MKIFNGILTNDSNLPPTSYSSFPSNLENEEWNYYSCIAGVQKDYLSVILYDETLKLYVAFGDYLYLSKNGTFWTHYKSCLNGVQGTSIVNYNGVLLIYPASWAGELSEGSYQGEAGCRSTDGHTWTNVTIPYSQTLFGVSTYSNGFVAYGNTGILYESKDAITWTVLVDFNKQEFLHHLNISYCTIFSSWGGNLFASILHGNPLVYPTTALVVFNSGNGWSVQSYLGQGFSFWQLVNTYQIVFGAWADSNGDPWVYYSTDNATSWVPFF